MPTNLPGSLNGCRAYVLFSQLDGLDGGCKEMGFGNDLQFYVKLGARPLNPHFHLKRNP